MVFAPDFKLSDELAPILETVLDAVVVITPEGRVTGWNAVAEETFGWRLQEALGRSLSDLIVPPQHRAAHEEGLLRITGGAAPRVLNRRIEITALHRDGREFPVELSITTTDTLTRGPVFVGFLRDISQRRRAEDALRRQAIESRLLFDLAKLAAEADSFEAALAQGVAAIGRISGWPVGHAFTVVDGDPPRLHSTDIWFEAEPGEADDMRLATAAIDWSEAVGLPGQILRTGEPLWVDDTEAADDFPRRRASFRGAFGFPLMCEGKTIAVLEFFSHSPAAPEEELLLSVRTLGEQIGRVFERRRRQDRERLLVRELNHRAKNLLMIVQSIARQSFRQETITEVAIEGFLGRLRALAGAHDLIMASDLRRVGLRDVVESAIDGCGNPLDRFDIAGDNLRIPASSGTSIVLAIHELCTNAHKYGALSNEGGRIALSWGVRPGSREFVFEWREAGGPPVSPPEREGFGTRLLARIVQAELGGRIDQQFLAEGLRLSFTANLPG